MRIRARHIMMLALVLVTAFILYATTLRRQDAKSDDALVGLAPPMDVPMAQAPEIALDSTHIDMGVIPNEGETKKEVPVYNRGGSMLEIVDVRTSCSKCTVGYFEAGTNQIAPGTSALLKIIVSPKGIHGFYSQKTLTLMCNDPRNPQMEVTVEAHVDPEYVLEPEGFDFGTVDKGAASRTSITLRSCTDTPVALLSATLSPEEKTPTDSDPITFTIEPVEESSRKQADRMEYRITAALTPEMRSGAFETPVFLHTDLKRFSTNRVLATGTVAAPYTVELSQNTPDLHLRNDKTETVTLYSDEAFQLENVRSEQGFFLIEQQSESEKHHSIQCIPSKELERGMHKDKLLFDVVQADARYTEGIRITVYAFGTMPEPAQE